MSVETVSRIPITPVLPGGASLLRSHKVNSVANLHNKRYISSGRVGIYHAIKLSNIGAGDDFLIPAYLCESVLEAVIETGATPVFYRIKSDTGIDLVDVKSRIGSKTRGILVTHFFGKRQNMQLIRTLCDSHSLVLLEDCAHSFFSGETGCSNGPVSDFLIASLPKFFPVYTGGVLASPMHSLDELKFDQRTLKSEVKDIYNQLEVTARSKRSIVITVLMALPLIARSVIKQYFSGKNRQADKQHTNDKPSKQSQYFDIRLARTRASVFSICVSHLANTRWQIQRRRLNYRYLSARLARVKGVKLLFDTVMDDFIPYVCPVLINDADKIKTMRRKNLHFWMWENIHNDICNVSIHYSKNLIQLPCHQSIEKKDMDMMMDIILETINEQP